MSASNLDTPSMPHGATGVSVRVLVIGPTPPPYHGVSVATQTLLGGGPHPGLEMLHLDIADRRGIQHVDQPDLHDVYLFCRQWLRLAWLLATRRPHVVYLSISQSTVGILRDGLFISLSRLFRSRIVIHLHGGNLPAWYAGRGWLLRAVVRRILRSCVRFIVLGETFREPLAALVGPEKIVVIPNGVPAAAPSAGHPREDAPWRLLFLSTLSREKGVIVLLDALAQLVRRGMAVELILAGPWLREADRTAALRFIGEQGLQAVARCSGAVDGARKAELLEWADMFVFPGTQQEGQPLVVLEAMAAGLPVLFSDRGCIAETVVDGECGLMVKTADAADLADKIAWLGAHPPERARLGANARRRYEAHYRDTEFVARVRAILVDACARTRPEHTPPAKGQQPTLEYFDRVAEQFQDNYTGRDAFKERRRVWERLIRASLPRPGPAALCMDMGCGDGRLGRTAAAAGVRTIGIDQSSEMLSLARAGAQRQQVDAHTEYVQAALPLPAELLLRYRGQVSLLLCSSVLEYIDGYEEVLEQFFELLRDDGRLIVSVPNARSFYRWGEKLLGKFLARRDSYLNYQRHTFDPRDFRACAERLGYAPVHEEYFALPWSVLGTRLFRGSVQRLATLYLLVAQKPRGAQALGSRLVA